MPRSHDNDSPVPDGLHKKFGARVRYLRLKLGLSQEELAGACGLDRTYVGGIERGERNPSLKNIYRIAYALRVPASALFDDSDPDQSSPKSGRRS
ncbi:MAG: helix-turn-helix transcriptional regulator [Terriglobia bacterium]|jgi:transcriptional regulator with XRE-family HTH domain